MRMSSGGAGFLQWQSRQIASSERMPIFLRIAISCFSLRECPAQARGVSQGFPRGRHGLVQQDRAR
jgi:hypothetical protein